MQLVFDDPELERERRQNVPDDATEEEQVHALLLMAQKAYRETAVRPEMHRVIAEDDGVLRQMVERYGFRLVRMPLDVIRSSGMVR